MVTARHPWLDDDHPLTDRVTFSEVAEGDTNPVERVGDLDHRPDLAGGAHASQRLEVALVHPGDEPRERRLSNVEDTFRTTRFRRGPNQACLGPVIVTLIPPSASTRIVSLSTAAPVKTLIDFELHRMTSPRRGANDGGRRRIPTGRSPNTGSGGRWPRHLTSS